MVLGRDISQMTPEERLRELARLLAVGVEIYLKNEENALAETRRAMAPCDKALNAPDPNPNLTNEERRRTDPRNCGRRIYLEARTFYE